MEQSRITGQMDQMSHSENPQFILFPIILHLLAKRRHISHFETIFRRKHFYVRFANIAIHSGNILNFSSKQDL